MLSRNNHGKCVLMNEQGKNNNYQFVKFNTKMQKHQNEDTYLKDLYIAGKRMEL